MEPRTSSDCTGTESRRSAEAFSFGNLFRQDMHQKTAIPIIGAITTTTIWPDGSVDQEELGAVLPLLWAQW